MGLIPRPLWALYRTAPVCSHAENMARDSRGEGSDPLSRGSSVGGCRPVFPITLLDNPPAEATYVIREDFGPLRAVIKYRNLDETVRLANGTAYGLGASVWGTDPESLDAVARRLDAGTVWINQHLNVHPNIPFSGYKNSGIGIEFGEDGLKEFCNVQVIANKR